MANDDAFLERLIAARKAACLVLLLGVGILVHLLR